MYKRQAETYSEVVKGMQFDRGYITPYMVTDTERMEAVLDDAYPVSYTHLDVYKRQRFVRWRTGFLYIKRGVLLHV